MCVCPQSWRPAVAAVAETWWLVPGAPPSASYTTTLVQHNINSYPPHICQKNLKIIGLYQGFLTGMVYLYNDSQDSPFWSKTLDMLFIKTKSKCSCAIQFLCLPRVLWFKLYRAFSKLCPLCCGSNYTGHSASCALCVVLQTIQGIQQAVPSVLCFKLYRAFSKLCPLCCASNYTGHSVSCALCDVVQTIQSIPQAVPSVLWFKRYRAFSKLCPLCCGSNDTGHSASCALCVFFFNRFTLPSPTKSSRTTTIPPSLPSTHPPAPPFHTPAPSLPPIPCPLPSTSLPPPFHPSPTPSLPHPCPLPSTHLPPPPFHTPAPSLPPIPPPPPFHPSPPPPFHPSTAPSLPPIPPGTSSSSYNYNHYYSFS